MRRDINISYSFSNHEIYDALFELVTFDLQGWSGYQIKGETSADRIKRAECLVLASSFARSDIGGVIGENLLGMLVLAYMYQWHFLPFMFFHSKAAGPMPCTPMDP